MAGNRSFEMGSLEKQPSLQMWVSEKITNIVKDERVPQEKIRNNSVKIGDTQLHLAVRTRNLAQVEDILSNSGGKSLEESIWKENSEGENALSIAAENDYIETVREILKAADRQLVSPDAINSARAFHNAAKFGCAEVVHELLRAAPNLITTTISSNATALYSAAAQGHTNVVKLLLDMDDSVASIARSNGKTVLHIAARMGHLEIVKMLLAKDPALSLRTDSKGQTALHMAAKGQDALIVREFLNNVSSVVRIVDNKGNTPLHTATRKGRTQIVIVLLSFRGLDINAFNKSGETALNIAEKYFNEEIASILREARADIAKKEKNDHVRPSSPNNLKQAVSFIKHGVQFQLKRSQRAQERVQELQKKVQRMKFSGLNNAVNSVNVVATLIASVAFAAIFQVPGQCASPGDDGYDPGEAYIASGSTAAAFLIFIVSDSLALFVSLAVVMVQTSLIVIDPKALKMMVFVINKLMWACCVSISVSFVSLSYVVIGSDDWWLTWSTVVVAALILLGTLGIMFYCVVKYRVQRKKIKKSVTKAVSGLGESFIRCSSLVTESLLRIECKKVYAI